MKACSGKIRLSLTLIYNTIAPLFYRRKEWSYSLGFIQVIL
jgi:hypothetical protein